MDKEARDLLREGQKPRGVLSRSNGESMKAFTDRRDRWWRRLKSLNSTIQVSEDILSQWMLDSANISETEKQLVQTTAKNEWKIETISHALQELFPFVHEKEGGTAALARQSKFAYAS